MRVIGRSNVACPQVMATSLSEVMSFLNRFVIPQLNMVQKDVMLGTGGTIVLPMGTSAVRPSGGTSGSFSAASEMVTGANTARILLDPDDYPADSGRAANYYVRVCGAMSAAGATSVEFELYNATTSESVGTILSTSYTTPSVAEVEFTPATGSNQYIIRSKRTGGTTEDALLIAAEIVIRYE